MGYGPSLYSQPPPPITEPPSLIGTKEAKKRLNAYAATYTDTSPFKRNKNKGLRKFFEEDNPNTVPIKVKPTTMDKMAEITKEIEQEKVIEGKNLEQKIKELQSRYKRDSRDRDGEKGTSRSLYEGTRDYRSKYRDRSRSRSRERRSRSRRSSSRDRGSKSRGEGEEDERPPPDPNTKEGRLELYRLELEKKTKKFLATEKKNRDRSPSDIALDKTRAFRVVEDTPSPQPEEEEQEYGDERVGRV